MKVIVALKDTAARVFGIPFVVQAAARTDVFPRGAGGVLHRADLRPVHVPAVPSSRSCVCEFGAVSGSCGGFRDGAAHRPEELGLLVSSWTELSPHGQLRARAQSL